MKLSLCLAVYNEEKNIHYPLDSAVDLVDEVVVVDGGSTDRTIEIAKSYGKKVRIIKTTNPQNFHINKQKAIDIASGEWILQLDADEELSPELKKEISNFIPPKAGQISNYSGYNIPRKNWFLTRFLMKGGVYPDYVLRLYKKQGAKFNTDEVHENIKIKGETGHLKNPILHYSDPTFSRYLSRWQRYTSFDAEKLYQETKKTGHKPSAVSYLFIKPTVWFFKTYFRHKGFMDGAPGFIFHFFSSTRFIAIYFKWKKLILSFSPGVEYQK